MKTAYELAMERLNKTAPVSKTSPEQKRKIAELNSRYSAKIAELEIAKKDEMNKAAEAGEWEKRDQIQQQWTHERKKLEADLEDKKEQVRRHK